jgi:hypothetical protein
MFLQIVEESAPKFQMGLCEDKAETPLAKGEGWRNDGG